MAEYIDTSINPADYIEVWEVEDAEHGKQLVMAVDDLKCLPPADVRPVRRGRWEETGKQMVLNLENARQQYADLGYPHRNILRLQCNACRKITLVDESILYRFCPHCGADMRGGDAVGGTED